MLSPFFLRKWHQLRACKPVKGSVNLCSNTTYWASCGRACEKWVYNLWNFPRNKLWQRLWYTFLFIFCSFQESFSALYELCCHIPSMLSFSFSYRSCLKNGSGHKGWCQRTKICHWCCKEAWDYDNTSKGACTSFRQGFFFPSPSLLYNMVCKFSLCYSLPQ